MFSPEFGIQHLNLLNPTPFDLLFTETQAFSQDFDIRCLKWNFYPFYVIIGCPVSIFSIVNLEILGCPKSEYFNQNRVTKRQLYKVTEIFKHPPPLLKLVCSIHVSIFGR